MPRLSGDCSAQMKAVDEPPLDVPSLDAFSVCLRQLQTLHQHQVFGLVREVAELRGELGKLGRKLGRSAWSADPSPEHSTPGSRAGSCTDELCVLKPQKVSFVASEALAVHSNFKRSSRSSSVAEALAAPSAPEAPETLDLPEPEPSKEARPEAKPEAKPEATPMRKGKSERWRERTVALDVKDMPVPLDAPGPRQALDLSSREETPPRHAQGLPAEQDLTFRVEAPDNSERGGSKASYPSSGSNPIRSISHTLHRSISAVNRRTQLLRQYDIFRAKNNSTAILTTCWGRVVSTPAFDFSMGCVIALNAIAIGVESSIVRSGSEVPGFLGVLDYIFLAVYTAELCMRFLAVGCKAMWSPWVQLDVLLVILGVVDISTKLAGYQAGRYADQADIVRTLRLARLARMVRLMGKSNTLWLLVQGLLNSLGTLVWTCIILLILLFIFSVLGLELLTPDPLASDEYNKIAEDHFGSLLRAMTTLLMGLSLDNFGEVYRPVVLEKPLTCMYFIPFFLIVPVALMNLVTALMVNFSMEQTSKDKAAEEQALAEQRAEKVKILEEAFRELDTDHCGKLDLQEMLSAPKELQDLIFDVADVKDHMQKDLTLIFKTLDFDKSGYLEIQEFCEGLLKLNDPTALETYATVRYCTNIASMLKEGGGGGLGVAVSKVANRMSISSRSM